MVELDEDQAKASPAYTQRQRQVSNKLPGPEFTLQRVLLPLSSHLQTKVPLHKAFSPSIVAKSVQPGQV